MSRWVRLLCTDEHIEGIAGHNAGRTWCEADSRIDRRRAGAMKISTLHFTSSTTRETIYLTCARYYRLFLYPAQVVLGTIHHSTRLSSTTDMQLIMRTKGYHSIAIVLQQHIGRIMPCLLSPFLPLFIVSSPFKCLPPAPPAQDSCTTSHPT
jgi:hypothetical protein